MLIPRMSRLPAFVIALAALGGPAAARAQLAGVVPKFPFAPAVPAPLGSIPAGQNVQWLGADGGSMALFPDNSTTFWAFGDSFLGPAGAVDRSKTAPTVVNTIALGFVSSGQFNPTYYFRGNYTYDGSGNATNLPSPFFLDPERYSKAPNNQPGFANEGGFPANDTFNNQPNQGHNLYEYDQLGNGPRLYNTDCSRYWAGKAIFYTGNGAYANYKLFVFLNRVDYTGTIMMGNYVARVENPVNAAGGANDPSLWNITYLKLSEVNTAGWAAMSPAPAGVPADNARFYITGTSDSISIGAEAFILTDFNDTQPSMFVFAGIPGATVPKNTILKIPMSAMLSTSNQSDAIDISTSIHYMPATGQPNGDQWVATNGSIPTATCKDANIPAGGFYTCRLLPNNTWRNVYIDAGSPSSILIRSSSAGPWGPWGTPQTVYTCPELNPQNKPYDIFHADKYGNNLGIYINQNPNAQIPGYQCYMAQELPAFSTSTQLAATYSCSPTDSGPYHAYPSNCPPQSSPWYYWNNNFYRVKGILETPQ